MKPTRFAAIAGLVVLGLVVQAADASARPGSQGSCPFRAAADVLCRMSGQVAHAPPTDSGPGTMRSTRRRARLPSGSTVRVRTRSRARIVFARDARCGLGIAGVPTELVTRFGAVPGGRSLYWMRKGRSRCTFTRGLGPRAFFCEISTECPVIVTTRGRAREITVMSPPVRTSQGAGVGQTAVTVVELAFCAPSVRVEVTDEFGGAVVEGGGSIQVDGVTYARRKRVRIVRTDTYTDTVETREIKLVSRPAPGYCRVPGR